MENLGFKPKPGWRKFPLHCLAWCIGSRVIRRGLFFAIAVPLFYPEENWRGRRAWDRYKHEQEVKGVGCEHLDTAPG